MPQIVRIPFATAATGYRPGGRAAEKFVLTDAVDVVVEERVAADFALVAVLQVGGHDNRDPQSVYAMEGRLWRPLEIGRTPLGGGLSSVPAARSLETFLSEGGWDLTGMRWELPAAASPRACYDRHGLYDYDRRYVRADYPRRIETTETEDARRRLADLGRSILVVDGDLWTECPAPRVMIDDVLSGPRVVIPSHVYFLQVHDACQGSRQVFRLDRFDEACAFCEAATSGAWNHQYDPSAFEIFDAQAIAFDDLVETAKVAAMANLIGAGRHLPWFSHAGLEEFAIARAAFGRLHEAPSRDDAVALCEAFGRLAADPGDSSGIFDPPHAQLVSDLGNLALRASAFETADVPDIDAGAPAP